MTFPNNWRDPARLTAVFDKLVEAHQLLPVSAERTSAAIKAAQNAVLLDIADAVGDFARFNDANKKRKGK